MFTIYCCTLPFFRTWCNRQNIPSYVEQPSLGQESRLSSNYSSQKYSFLHPSPRMITGHYSCTWFFFQNCIPKLFLGQGLLNKLERGIVLFLSFTVDLVQWNRTCFGIEYNFSFFQEWLFLQDYVFWSFIGFKLQWPSTQQRLQKVRGSSSGSVISVLSTLSMSACIILSCSYRSICTRGRPRFCYPTVNIYHIQGSKILPLVRI